jgi:hypothetical protein
MNFCQCVEVHKYGKRPWWRSKTDPKKAGRRTNSEEMLGLASWKQSVSNSRSRSLNSDCFLTVIIAKATTSKAEPLRAIPRRPEGLLQAMKVRKVHLVIPITWVNREEEDIEARLISRHKEELEEVLDGFKQGTLKAVRTTNKQQAVPRGSFQACLSLADRGGCKWQENTVFRRCNSPLLSHCMWVDG